MRATAAGVRVRASPNRLASSDLSRSAAIAKSPIPTARQDHPEMGVSWLASKSTPPTIRAIAAVSKALGILAFPIRRV